MLVDDYDPACEDSASRREALRSIVLSWAGEHPHSYPWRQPEASPWGILTAEIMLQRTNASRVVPIWSEFSRRYPEPLSAARAPAEVEALLRPLGLSKRTAALLALAQALSGGRSMPTTRAELVQLPGVGAYTADAYLCLTKSSDRMPIDSNISRFVHRLANKDLGPQSHRTAATRLLVEAQLGDDVTPRLLQAILDFTMGVCSTVPRCAVCPIRASTLCAHYMRCQGQSSE